MCLQIQKSPEKGKKMTNESHSSQVLIFFRIQKNTPLKNPKSIVRILSNFNTVIKRAQ